MVEGGSSEIIGGLVPESRIQLHVFRLLTVLFPDIILVHRIQQAGTDYADRGFQAEGQVGRDRIGIEGGSRDVDFRIDQFVFFTVLELHRQTAFHGRDIVPGDGYLGLVDRRQERSGRHGLRHARHLGDIRAVVAARSHRMVDDQQVTVAAGTGIIRNIDRLPFSVAVVRVAVQAGLADRRRAQALERCRVQGHIPFEKHLAVVEGDVQALRGNGRRRIFVAAFRYIQGRSQPTARIPLVRLEVSNGLPDILRIGLMGFRRIRPVLAASGDPKGHHSHQKK